MGLRRLEEQRRELVVEPRSGCVVRSRSEPRCFQVTELTVPKPEVSELTSAVKIIHVDYHEDDAKQTSPLNNNGDEDKPNADVETKANADVETKATNPPLPQLDCGVADDSPDPPTPRKRQQSQSPARGSKAERSQKGSREPPHVVVSLRSERGSFLRKGSGAGGACTRGGASGSATLAPRPGKNL